MKRNLYVAAIFLTLFGALALANQILERRAADTSSAMAPRFEVDPLWPKPLPNHWLLGQTIGVSVDAQEHIWIIHRGSSLEPGELHATTNPKTSECCGPAPPILSFDQEGNLVTSWGGPGEGFDWPASNHGITIDYKGNVWIGGNGRGPQPPPAQAAANEGQTGGIQGYFNDSMVLKFTQAGKFLLQIGKPGQTKGSNDVQNLRLPAKTFVDKMADEVYVADGYGNHRVIVYDAETGRYKRHWGAYGNKPADVDLGNYDPNAPPAQQFRNPVHCAELSVDRLLYVCDRANDRVQVFRPEGTFVKEMFIMRETRGSGSAWDIAFSKDAEQKYMYLTDGENNRVHIIERASLTHLTSFGDGGRQPGAFYGVHSIATDSKGNIYTTETYRGQRLQKFVYKGIAPVTTKNQGVVWPKFRTE